jgi:hypothetical protein
MPCERSFPPITPNLSMPNKRLQLTPNSSFESFRGTVLAAGAVAQRWRSALLGAAEPPVRWAVACEEAAVIDAKDAITRFGRSTRSFLETLDGVSDPAWQVPPAGEAWSLAETVEHVVLANRLRAAPAAPFPLAPRASMTPRSPPACSTAPRPRRRTSPSRRAASPRAPRVLRHSCRSMTSWSRGGAGRQPTSAPTGFPIRCLAFSTAYSGCSSRRRTPTITCRSCVRCERIASSLRKARTAEPQSDGGDARCPTSR